MPIELTVEQINEALIDDRRNLTAERDELRALVKDVADYLEHRTYVYGGSVEAMLLTRARNILKS